MATPDQAAELIKQHNCQTPDCAQPFDVIVFRVGDSMAQWLCWACAAAFWMAVLEKMAREGQVQLADSLPAPAGAATT